MKAIVNVDANWGIGCNGELLQHIPEDMKFFKEKTLNNVVVMGRETFESLPGKSPLKDRINIVLSKNKTFEDDRLIICHSIDQTLEELKKYDNNKIFIIGGEAIYRQFITYCDEIYVTKLTNEYIADKYFPNLDSDPNWILEDEGEQKENKGIKYRFTKYINKNL